MGEYTTNHARQTSHTQQFRLQDIAFFHQHKPISFGNLQENPSLPDLVRLRIDHQKNGRRGQIIAHHAIQSPWCPVKALTARTLTLLNDGANPDTPICAFCNEQDNQLQHVTNEDIIHAIRAALPFNQEATPGYLPKLIGSHSLHTGGAMALFLNGFDTTAIMKIGRWTSTAFMSYIHEQLDVVSYGASERMAIATTFTNLATDMP